MKNMKGMVGLAVFVMCLWAVVVTTYASQASNNGLGKDADAFPMQTPTSCSSSSSSSGVE